MAAGADDHIRAKCFHPAGKFVEFAREDVEQSIPTLFDKIVRKYPDRLAIKTKHHELSYDQVNRVANRLARAILAHCGEGQEQVALLLEHDAPLIAAMIGVLKAGKVYVPLDPSYPRERLAYMLEDAEASLILTNKINRSLVHALPQKVQVIDIDEARLDFARSEPQFTPLTREPGLHPLYVWLDRNTQGLFADTSQRYPRH